MRTIRYTFVSALPSDTPGHHHIELSTEIILDNDADAFEEGAKMKGLFDDLLDGLSQEE